MEVYYNLKKSKINTAVALGFFDGVHVAHQKIISKTVEYSKKGLKPCVLTFQQNPRSVVENIKLDLITTTEQKLEIMENMGVELAYILNFNSVMDMLPEYFVTEILHNTLSAKAVFCGFNYRFGKNGAGDTNMLKKFCRRLGIEVFVQSPILYENKPISSTRIRSAIKNKDFKVAGDMLGR